MLSLYAIFEFVSENSLIVSLLCIGLFSCIGRRYGILFIKTESTEETNYCNDENCVRCNKYHDTVVNAMKKIPSIRDATISLKIQNGIDSVHRPQGSVLKQMPNVFLYDNLTARNIWTKEFKEKLIDCFALEKYYQTVKDETEFLLQNTNLGVWKRNKTPNGSWDVFHLINQGSAILENQALCPKTMDVINSLTSAMKNNVFGNVMLSVLKPGTEITPHYGPTNIRLRCHLGLQVVPDCLLTVDGEMLTWEQGKCLLFDDSFLHSVTHAGHVISDMSPQPVARIVLIVDLWHPDLSPNEKETIDMCFRPQA